MSRNKTVKTSQSEGLRSGLPFQILKPADAHALAFRRADGGGERGLERFGEIAEVGPLRFYTRSCVRRATAGKYALTPLGLQAPGLRG